MAFFSAVFHAWQHCAAGSWAGEGDAPVGATMGTGVMRWGGCGEVLRGADGVSWLVPICPRTTGGFKAHGRIVWE